MLAPGGLIFGTDVPSMILQVGRPSHLRAICVSVIFRYVALVIGLCPSLTGRQALGRCWDWAGGAVAQCRLPIPGNINTQEQQRNQKGNRSGPEMGRNRNDVEWNETEFTPKHIELEFDRMGPHWLAYTQAINKTVRTVAVRTPADQN
jgi:hypothetical protein